MALQLNKDLGNGFLASYAVITNLNIDFINQTSIMNMSYYKDQASYEAGLAPVAVDTPQLNGPDFPFDSVSLQSNSPLDLAYTAVALQPDFVQNAAQVAVDVNGPATSKVPGKVVSPPQPADPIKPS